MKKMFVGFMAVLTLVAFTSMVFAAQAPKSDPAKVVVKDLYVTGSIVKIEKAKNEIVLKEASGEKTFIVKPAELDKLTVGEKVRLEVKKGTNRAEKIKALVE
ncbi:MAG TPA: hypothetical protein PLT09_07080 [Deltaproteobacteria bacterium]|nr:hypothetical protein [Deltaproteobacteria bacterium]HPR53671.1 hypothetical protein [Deltaproteobacteria bacterium]HXK47187.1 hypothetical protein [Deltaproteobacteria bacterium]